MMHKITITNKPSADLMTHFVSKSSLSVMLSTLPRNKKESFLIQELKEAIKSGQPDHPLFSDPNASLYVLFLMENKSIRFSEGWTVLMYLMVLAQFSEKQPLRPEDSDIRILSGKDIEVLGFNDRENQEVKEYIATLIKRKTKFPLDVSAFYGQLSSLSPTEQWLMKIPLTEENITPRQREEIIRFLKANLSRNLPLVQVYCDSYLLIPSFSIISIYCQRINPEFNILAVPIYGVINTKTLLDFHQQRLHPIAFYSIFVKSNLALVHNRRAGPIPAMLHDFLHIFMALQLTKKEYDFVFDYLIPLLQEFADRFKYDKPLMEKCSQAIEALADLDLTFYGGFKHFGQYTKSALNIYESHQNEFLPAGSCVEDSLYFLLLQRLRQDSDLLRDKYDFYESDIYHCIAATGDFHRQTCEVEKIRNLAKNDNASSLAEAKLQALNSTVSTSLGSSSLVFFKEPSLSTKNHSDLATSKSRCLIN